MAMGACGEEDVSLSLSLSSSWPSLGPVNRSVWFIYRYLPWLFMPPLPLPPAAGGRGGGRGRGGMHAYRNGGGATSTGSADVAERARRQMFDPAVPCDSLRQHVRVCRVSRAPL